MTIDKQNPTHQREQPLSLFSLSTIDMVLPVSSTPKSRRDPIAQRAFLRSMIASALEITADFDDFFLEDDRSSDNAEDEDSRSLNRRQ
jgi:hypothetical protein